VLPTCSNGQKGGFADFLTCDSRFVFLLPDNLPSHVAAPLFCAGQTVFTALLRAPGQAWVRQFRRIPSSLRLGLTR
jgi:D-arabinose 1-dehydrogenase-like Zn-dependent alcohol dehydrogenase